MKCRDLTGKKFGRLTVIKRSGYKSNRIAWICLCDCGKTKKLAGESLGRTTNSCGCLRVENTIKMRTTHGLSKTRAFKIWAAMRDRCTNRRTPAFKWYGARGISVCKKWADFEVFFRDMGEPKPKETIDRINNDGPYSKENCRWTTRKEQARNRTTNKVIKYKNKSKTLAQWAEETGIQRATIAMRLKYGWTIKRALSVDPNIYRTRGAKAAR